MKGLFRIVLVLFFTVSVCMNCRDLQAQTIIKHSIIGTKSAQNYADDEKSTPVKVFFLVEVSLLAVIVLLWRRRKTSKRKTTKSTAAAKPQSEFKKNVIKLRQEKIEPKENPHLSKLRRKLQVSPACLNTKKDIVADNARKLAISKEEIYLAARIKSYAMANECSAK
jgi:hypothetical protein